MPQDQASDRFYDEPNDGIEVTQYKAHVLTLLLQGGPFRHPLTHNPNHRFDLGPPNPTMRETD